VSGSGATDPQARIEREELARGRRAPGAAPVTARPAATTVVVRPASPESFEVLLLERPSTSRFAAGAFVFPGGVVDRADGSGFWTDRLPPLPNLPPDGRPACTAALRELFEETGLFLSDEAVTDRSRLVTAREALLADARTFDDIVAELDASFRGAPMSYFARWITPRDLARRYDTLFFLVALPGRDDAVTITVEHVSAVWLAPAEALDRCAEDRLPMLFPTRETLRRLAAFEGLEEAMTSLGGAPVQPIEPRLDVQGDTVTPRLPDDGEPT